MQIKLRKKMPNKPQDASPKIVVLAFLVLPHVSSHFLLLIPDSDEL